MTQTEFLLGMLEYYTVDPKNRRCARESQCSYYAGNISEEKLKTSEGCAIGRKVPEELRKELDKQKLGAVYSDDIFNLLPKELQDLERDFLGMVQKLHDFDNNWYPEKLSILGQQRLKLIIEKYNLNLELFKKFLPEFPFSN